MPNPPIVLTTDFGAADSYVGVMKGVILRINPQATIIDLTHQIAPQNISQAAFVLGTSYQFFPPGSIHLVVVDPGVGTARRAVLLVTPQARFLAPDNGALSYVLRDYLDQPSPGTGRITVPKNCAAYQLTNPAYWLHPVSNTFHGRDVFSPVAAHLSLGVAPEELGQPVADLVALPMPKPQRLDSTLWGEVIYIDHFGNLVTNIPAGELGGAKGIQVAIKGQVINRLSQTFHDVASGAGPKLVALIGSHGYLEIALADGSAANTLGATPGEPVRVAFG